MWSKADRASRDLEKWKASTRPYREHFYDDVIGRFDRQLLPPNVRTRQIYDEPQYTGYEVCWTSFPTCSPTASCWCPRTSSRASGGRSSFASTGSKAGRPTWPIRKKFNPSYNQYACRLAERGFIIYAPQNPYIFTDKFRTLAAQGESAGQDAVFDHRAAAPADWSIGWPRCRTSIPSGSHSTACRTAARRPCACRRSSSAIACRSARPTSTNGFGRTPRPARPTATCPRGEYEIFEFDLGNTYNYAEMAALIAPRPFMVERGHRDGVGPDTWVSYEYAKIRLLYADLKIPERTTIEFFDGPHTIHGVGTFDFLHKHLELAGPAEPLAIGRGGLLRPARAVVRPSVGISY